jgi:hypothetical protein
MTKTTLPGKLAIGDQNGHGGIEIYPLDRRDITIATVYLNVVTSAKSWGEEHFALPENAEPVAIANRFVALWNACEGIANPDVVPEAIAALRGVRWRSADRDNMEFVATITYSQMDKLRAILAKLEGRS